MSSGFNILRAFAVCAALSACGHKIPEIDTADTADAATAPAQAAPMGGPVKKATTLEDIDGFGEPGSPLLFADNIFIAMFLHVPSEPCLRLPKDAFTFVKQDWVYECGTGIRATRSGDYLVEQMLRTEYLKKTGQYVTPKSYPDKHAAFRFVG